MCSGVGVNRPLKRALGGQWPKKFEKHCSIMLILKMKINDPCDLSRTNEKIFVVGWGLIGL